jgi:hypothetical protein
MTSFWKRLRFYLIGFGLGLCFVAIFFGPKAMQCSYFPNARALEEAKIYPMSFSEQTQKVIDSEKIDSVFMYNELLKKSKITNFGTDEVRATPCRTYRAQYRESKSYDLVFKICKKKTIIEELKAIH